MPEEKPKRKRLYVFDSDDGYDCYRCAIVHTSLKEAKKVLWDDSYVRDCLGGEYTLFNAHWLKDVDVSDLEVGDDLISVEGVRRGVYLWVDDNCPECGKVGELRMDDDWGKVMCEDCGERTYQEYQAALSTICDAHPDLTQNGGGK